MGGAGKAEKARTSKPAEQAAAGRTPSHLPHNLNSRPEARLAQAILTSPVLQARAAEVRGAFGAALDVRPPNLTGLPERLKASVEALSGVSLDNVRVHRNSDRPARLGALAYAQGRDIHLGPGQEKHLPHEAWHVVQQAQGRVKPTMQMKEGVAVNDDAGLEREADAMGLRAAQASSAVLSANATPVSDCDVKAVSAWASLVVQRYKISYGALHNGCGTVMHVCIYGSKDPDLNKGSAPSVVPYWWPTSGKEGEYFTRYVVQGHLLNEELGGPGYTMANLTPLTRSANTTHFRSIEKEVKELVAKNYIVEYRVELYYTSHPTAATAGNSPPADAIPYFAYMAGVIGADYTVYDPVTKAQVGGLPGELLIKNEGPQLKGPFV